MNEEVIQEKLEEIINSNLEDGQGQKYFWQGIGFIACGVALAVAGYASSKLDEVSEHQEGEAVDEEDEVSPEPTEEDSELPMQEVAEKADEEETEEDIITEPEKEDDPKGSEKKEESESEVEDIVKDIEKKLDK